MLQWHNTATSELKLSVKITRQTSGPSVQRVICTLCWHRRATARPPFAPGSVHSGIKELHQEKVQLLQPHPPLGSAQSCDQHQTQADVKDPPLWNCQRLCKAFQRSHHRKVGKVLSHWQGGERDTGNNPQSFLPAKSDAFLSLAVQLKSFDLWFQNWKNDWLEAFPPALPSSISS